MFRGPYRIWVETLGTDNVFMFHFGQQEDRQSFVRGRECGLGDLINN